jgi:RNA polymerase sigma factor (TIGR02999 family)
MSDPPAAVTQLLLDWSKGDPAALEKLIPLVFSDLREIAGRLFRRESEAHTLQPTALVSEVYFRLLKQRNLRWQNREQFFSVAALLMRRILVDYAKGRSARKRGGDAMNLPLDEALEVAHLRPDLDLVGLDQALSRLAEIDPRQSQVVELRFFVGLSHEEIGDLLGLSVTTVKREWRTAKLWLYRALTEG